MNQAALDDAERRRYFRIDDEVALKLRALNDEQLAQAVSHLHIGYPDKIQLASSFATTSAQMKHSLERVRRDVPDIANYLEALNEKLDTLVQLLAASDNEMADHPTHNVNLSASGISFQSDESLVMGTHAEIKLLMFPSYVCILAYGDIVYCSKSKAGPKDGQRYDIGIDFTHIRENDRELIIKHVTHKQSALIREARMAFND